jgi:hypothetical protein
MGNISDKHIKKITHKELRNNNDEYVLINIYTDVEDVIHGTILVSEEDYYIDKALKENKKIVFYGYDKYDIKYYKHIYEVYGPLIGYEHLYFYENGLKEWVLFNRLYGNNEYPIYRYV